MGVAVVDQQGRDVNVDFTTPVSRVMTLKKVEMLTTAVNFAYLTFHQLTL